MNNRLEPKNIKDLSILMCGRRPFSESIAEKMCTGKDPIIPGMQVYGVFEGDDLVATMTAIFFVTRDNTRMAYVSDLFAREDVDVEGYASKLLGSVRKDAVDYFKATYLYDEKGVCITL